MNDRLAGRIDAGMERLRFDYDCLPSAVAKFLKGQADRIKRHCATSTVQIGKSLLEAKHHLSHGEFLGWVESEAGIPVRTAQAYMRVANWASAKGAKVAHLAPSALYLLSASTTPRDFVADVLSRVEAGEHIAPSVLRNELAALRKAEQQQRVEAERLRPQVPSVESSIAIHATESMAIGNAMIELVEILARGLSEADFERVRCIATSDEVLSDQQLGKRFARAFSGYGTWTEVMDLSSLQVSSPDGYAATALRATSCRENDGLSHKAGDAVGSDASL